MTADIGNPSARQALLEQLARRCETEEPSRDLDADIAVACRMAPDFDESIYIVPLVWRPHYGRVLIGRYLPDRQGAWWLEASRVAASFTSSLDAAVTLVPEQAASWGAHGARGGLGYGEICTPQEPHFFKADAATPALALCAAALRARATL